MGMWIVLCCVNSSITRQRKCESFRIIGSYVTFLDMMELGVFGIF